ncbi:MAG: PAS domain S-box protein [Ignavibacteria bacterium]|nr:PAS domain S-box protein [Ignavibacteria bacterium]
MGNSDILSRFLLIQNSVIELNDKDEIKNLICSGLSDLPGIKDIKILCENISSGNEDIRKYELAKGCNLIYTISNNKLFDPFEKYVTAFCKTLSIILQNKNCGKDITENSGDGKNNDIEIELINCKEKYQRIFNNVQDIYFELSEDGTVLEISPAISTLSKGLINKDEMLNKNLLEYYADISDREKLRTQLYKNGYVKDFELGMRNKDENIVYVELSAKVVDDKSKSSIKIVGNLHDITKRKETETKLKKSQEKFSRVFRAMPEAIALSRLEDGVFCMVNDKFLSYTHYTEEEVIGKTSRDLKMYENPEDGLKFYQTILNNGYVENYFTKYRIKSGEIIDGLVSASVVEADNNKFILIIMRDVSHWKKTEQKLLESEKNYRELIDGMNETVWVINFKGELLDVNKTAIMQLGYAKKELLEIGLEGIDASISKENIKALARAMPKDEMQIFESVHKTKDGKQIPVEVYSSLISYYSEQAILSIARDITERKKAEELIKKEREQLLSIFNGIDEVVYITDPETNEILYVNKFFQNMLPRPCLGRICYEEFQGLNSPCEFCTSKIILENKYEPYKWEFYNKNLNKYFSITDRIIRWSDGRDVRFELAIDITEQKVAEQNLLIAKEKAEKADNLKSEFLAQMSHEIRSPINTILNSVSLIKEDLNGYGGEIKEIFPIIDAAGSRIIKTIDAILNMSELQLGIYEPNLKKWNLVEDILNMLVREFKHLAEIKSLNFLFEIQTHNTDVYVDQYSATQIFSNLIDNAIKYTQNGSITVSVYKNHKNNISVDVADTGIGISEEFLPHIFSPFSQEEQGYSRKYEGNGLGLALISKYCSFNNAEISVKSKKNQGSVFTVEFK